MGKKSLSRQKVEKKVNDVLVEKLGIGYSEIDPDALLEQDYDADSLDIIEVVTGLEKSFDLSISDRELTEISTGKVGDIYDFIERRSGFSGCEMIKG